MFFVITGHYGATEFYVIYPLIFFVEQNKSRRKWNCSFCIENITEFTKIVREKLLPYFSDLFVIFIFIFHFVRKITGTAPARKQVIDRWPFLFYFFEQVFRKIKEKWPTIDYLF